MTRSVSGPAARRGSFAAVCLLSFAACYGSSEPLASDTGVSVLVSRGPIDPVEIQGQSTNTAPVAGARVLVRPVGDDDAREAKTDDDGLARILLAPGSYTISVAECPGAMSLPKENATITVTAGAFTSTSLVCDTGIR